MVNSRNICVNQRNLWSLVSGRVFFGSSSKSVKSVVKIGFRGWGLEFEGKAAVINEICGKIIEVCVRVVKRKSRGLNHQLFCDAYFIILRIQLPLV